MCILRNSANGAYLNLTEDTAYWEMAHNALMLEHFRLLSASRPTIEHRKSEIYKQLSIIGENYDPYRFVKTLESAVLKHIEKETNAKSCGICTEVYVCDQMRGMATGYVYGVSRMRD